jgi:uncharacterized protein with HEPN domain
MPLRDRAVYLEDIERYAEAAQRFAAGCDVDGYLADDKTRAAVERVLEICGEAMRQLFIAAPEIANRIPHSRDIVGFRNILAWLRRDRSREDLRHHFDACSGAASKRARRTDCLSGFRVDVARRLLTPTSA